MRCAIGKLRSLTLHGRGGQHDGRVHPRDAPTVNTTVPRLVVVVQEKVASVGRWHQARRERVARLAFHGEKANGLRSLVGATVERDGAVGHTKLANKKTIAEVKKLVGFRILPKFT